MRATIKKTLALGATYAVAIVCGLVTAKVLANSVGPLGYGYFSLYGAVLTTGWMLTALGVPAALPRFGASVIGTESWSNLKAAGVAITTVSSLLAALLLIILRQPIGKWALHQPLGLAPALMLAVAFVFGAQTPVQNAILKTEQVLRPLVIADSLTALGTSVVTIVMVATFRVDGIIPAIALAAVLKWVIFSRWAGKLPHSGIRDGMVAAAKTLLRFGITYSLSVTLANLLAVTLPVIILHVSNLANVGLYAAATGVVGMYVGLLSSILGRDFYPRIAGLDLAHPHLRRIVAEEHDLMIVLALPASVLLIALSPIVIPLVYSRHFLPMDGLISWLAVAAILRLSSAVYGYVVLAKLTAREYLALEGLSGVVAFGLAIAGLLCWGLVGIGVAAVFSAGVHLVYAVHLVRKSAGFSMTVQGKRGAVVATAVAGAMLAIQWIPMTEWRSVITVAMTMGSGLVCLQALRTRWVGDGKGVLLSLPAVDE